MPHAKLKPDVDPNDLEKKVDQMMAPNAPDETPTPTVEPAKPVMTATSEPAGVPEVPKELSKDLDAFSTEAPDINPETDEPQKDPATPEQVAEPETPAKPTSKSPDTIESPATDEAVTDIVREEADKLLATDDAESQADEETSRPKALKSKWWRSKKFIYTVVFIVLATVVGLAAWPTSRYAVMNTAGIRSKASIKIIDNSTNLPLSNVNVAIGSVKVKTNEQGVASFEMIKLGKQPLVIERVAFAEIKKDIVVGWGSNPLGEVALQATGVRYELKVTDFASKKPVKATADSGEANATSDKNGVIKLVVDDVDKKTVDITVQSDGYRTEKLTIAADKKTVSEVVMVPDKPVVYVSKQSGKYDVYSVDVDGKNKKLLLAGTGREGQDIKVASSPDGSKAAVVSTRGTKRDLAGNILQTLTLVDTKTAESKTIDDAGAVTLVDWVDTRLVYVASYPASTKDAVQEQRLISYNTDESARSALATSTYFSAVASVAGYVYFAAINDDPAQLTAYQKVRVDGSGKQTILQARVLSAIRTDYALFSLETADGWFAYKTGNAEATKATAPPDSYVSKQYFVSPSGTQSAWVDSRDGKGVLVVRDQATDKETVLAAVGGLVSPVRWLNDTTIAYRVSNLNETADYIKSLNGGEAHKVTNVTNTTGLSINF